MTSAFDAFGEDSFNTGYQNAQARRLNDIMVEQKALDLRQDQEKSQVAQQDQLRLQNVLEQGRNKTALELSRDLIDQGQIKLGGNLMKAAAQAQQSLASAEKTNVEAEDKRLNHYLNEIKAFSNLVDNTHSQEEYTKAIEQFWPQNVPMPSTIKDAQWSPEFKERLKNLSMNWKDKTELRLKELHAGRQEKSLEMQDELRKTQIAKNQAQIKEIQTRTEKVQKNEGKTPTVNKADIQQVSDLIGEDFPDEGDTATRANAAYTIASRAEKLLTQNRALDRATAIQQAYNEAKTNGELGLEEEGGFRIPFTDTTIGGEERLKFKNKAAEGKITPKIDSIKENFLKQHPGTDFEAAEKYLKQNPQFKEKFKETFGYLPE